MTPGIKQRRATPMIDDGWMSLVAAAKALGMARLRVTRYALQGALEHQTIAGRTVISRASVEKLQRELRKSA